MLIYVEYAPGSTGSGLSGKVPPLQGQIETTFRINVSNVSNRIMKQSSFTFEMKGIQHLSAPDFA